MKRLFPLLALLLMCTMSTYAQITSAATGNWNSTSTWTGGVIPGPTDDVVIANGHKVTLDSTAASYTVANLTISGTLNFAANDIINLTVTGNITINSGGTFKVLARTSGNHEVIHTVTLHGDLSNAGTFDMRTGSAGTTLGVINFMFAGTGNSTVTMGAFSSSNNEFNLFEINKSGSGRVILGSDVGAGNGASGQPNANAGIKLTQGIIQTGAYKIFCVFATSTSIIGGSSSSYVLGTLGRALGTSSGGSGIFPVGDENGYRPFTLHSTTGGTNTGYYSWVSCITGNANPGSSVLNGGISNVSAVRYYQVGYTVATAYTTGQNPATAMTYDLFAPSYGNDDGVAAGNTDLRVAYSTDNRSSWNAISQTTSASTLPSANPTTITPDAVGSPITVPSDANSIFITLANTTGGANPLPVEIQSFTAQARGGAVELAWSTATEVNNAGFEIEKLADGAWTSIGFVAGAGTSNSPKQYAFAEKNVASGAYSYRLKQIDRDGKVEYSKSVTVNVAGAPTELSLVGNYPNPFNPATTVKFTVPSEGRAMVKVFNILGKEVAEIFNEAVVSGKLYSASFNASSLPSGIYFSRLEFGGRTMVKKMMLMK